MKNILILILATALLCGCANHTLSFGPGEAIGAVWEVLTTLDPNELTAEDREIMRREQEEEARGENNSEIVWRPAVK